MRRVALVGTTGSGKSTLAERLSPLLGAPVVELDALFWRPGWNSAPEETFRGLVGEATGAERWIVVGNYGRMRDLVWRRADTLVWLDLPLARVMARLLRRTVRRIVSGEDLWGTGNRETFRRAFLDRRSILLWALRTHRANGRAFAAAAAEPSHAHLAVHRLRRPAEIGDFLERVARGAGVVSRATPATDRP